MFVRWWVDQVGAEHARRVRGAFLAGRVRLETVDRVRPELGDVLRRKAWGRGLDDDFVSAVRAVDDLSVTVHASDADALERAARLCVA